MKTKEQLLEMTLEVIKATKGKKKIAQLIREVYEVIKEKSNE